MKFPRVPMFAALLAGVAISSPASEEITFDVAEPTGGLLDLPGNMSVGLEFGIWSDFIFRGAELGDTSGDARAEWMTPVGSNTVLSAGARYIGGGDYEQGEAFAGLQHAMGPLSFATGYRYFFLDAGDRSEIGLMLGTRIVGIDWSLAYFYDWRFEGSYVELAAKHLWELADPFSLKFSGGVSGASDYWTDGSGMNHAFLQIDMPIRVSDGFTVSPWIAASMPLSQIDDVFDDKVFGGLRVGIDF